MAGRTSTACNCCRAQAKASRITCNMTAINPLIKDCKLTEWTEWIMSRYNVASKCKNYALYKVKVTAIHWQLNCYIPWKELNPLGLYSIGRIGGNQVWSKGMAAPIPWMKSPSPASRHPLKSMTIRETERVKIKKQCTRW